MHMWGRVVLTYQPFEDGIDDKTRIDRFIEEVKELKYQVEKLEQENYELRIKLGLEENQPF